MTDSAPPTPDRNRRVIPITCSAHGGARGFTSLVVRKLDGEIELEPHGLRCCVLVLNEAAATQLFDVLGECLG